MERQKIEAIFDEVVDLQTQKNKEYGNSFEESLDEFGRIAGVVQVSHKFNRLKQIANDETVKFETERDTAIDIIGYMVMYVAWLDKQSALKCANAALDQVQLKWDKFDALGNDESALR